MGGSGGDTGPENVAGNTAGSGGEPDQPAMSPSPCGELRRRNTRLMNGESCIEASEFLMGSSEPSLGAGYTLHSPPHRVTLSTFALDQHEVTVARYRECVDDGRCSAPSGQAAQGCTYTAALGEREFKPVTCVNHSQALAFCAWDGGRTLPTEAQWERAARGVRALPYPWGSTFACHRAVISGGAQCDQWAGALPQDVGSTQSGVSLEGVFDLVGNVAEWVADYNGRYGAEPEEDPLGPAAGSTRVQRGGGWLTLAVNAVAHARTAVTPEAVGPFGFRCARAP